MFIGIIPKIVSGIEDLKAATILNADTEEGVISMIFGREGTALSIKSCSARLIYLDFFIVIQLQ